MQAPPGVYPSVRDHWLWTSCTISSYARPTMRIPTLGRSSFALVALAGALCAPTPALAESGQRAALLPGAAGADYAGQHGLPRSPADAAEAGVYDLTQYTFTDLPFGK